MTTKEEVAVLLAEFWKGPTEERTEQKVERMNVLSPDPGWSNYIYYSDALVKSDGVLDVTDVVDKIFSIRPIAPDGGV